MDQTKSEQQIQQILSNAAPDEKYRKDIPQIQITFPEQDFYLFKIQDNQTQIQLKTYRYLPQGQPKTFVIFFHGLGSHQGGGAHIAADFAKLGCESDGYDQKGHGQSQGERGLIESRDQHMVTAQKFLDEMVDLYRVKKNLPDLPIFVTGLSLGDLTSFTIDIALHKIIIFINTALHKFDFRQGTDMSVVQQYKLQYFQLKLQFPL